MRLIIGLGNPGPRYTRSKHNFGYWAVEALARSRQLVFAPGRGDYLVAAQQPDDLALIKPASFMNESGLPVKEALEYFGSNPEDMLVVFDDIDLPLGSLRFRARGGAGGHKGMTSLIYHLGSEDFPRLRLGIATDAPLRPSEKYVLEPFRPRDKPLVERILEEAVNGINHFLESDMERTMSRYNINLEMDESR